MMGHPNYHKWRAKNGSMCLLTRIMWPSEWSMAPLNNSRDSSQWGSGKAKRSCWFTGSTVVRPPVHGCWWSCDSVSGTTFWVKALPLVMTSFSRASFDWAVHFPQWMHTARPPLMHWMSLQIIHGWQTGKQVALQSIRLGSVQCQSKETQVEPWLRSQTRKLPRTEETLKEGKEQRVENSVNE